jgi:ElaB/YqjD/DUF883 family membrane-anchored ribosome-binding protein
MSAASEQLTKVEEQILDTISNLQKPVIDAVKTLAEKAESYVPDVPGTDNLPAIDELILSQFAFLEKVLANQKDFAGALLEAIKPVAKAAEPKTRAKTTTKAAAAA